MFNLEDLVLLGPGSEWFWTMVSGLVLAITFIAIYRQLRLQAGAGAVEQMQAIQREWQTEAMLRHRLAILSQIRDGLDWSKVSIGAATEICDYWERLGYLVRAGHVGSRLVHEYNGPAARLWWGFLEPKVQAIRVDFAQPKLSEHFEWLARRMTEMDGPAAVQLDEAYLRRVLPSLVESHLEVIRVAERTRAASETAI